MNGKFGKLRLSDWPGMMRLGETSGPCVEPWPPPRLISVALYRPPWKPRLVDDIRPFDSMMRRDFVVSQLSGELEFSALATSQLPLATWTQSTVPFEANTVPLTKRLVTPV